MVPSVLYSHSMIGPTKTYYRETPFKTFVEISHVTRSSAVSSTVDGRLITAERRKDSSSEEIGAVYFHLCI